MTTESSGARRHILKLQKGYFQRTTPSLTQLLTKQQVSTNYLYNLFCPNKEKVMQIFTIEASCFWIKAKIIVSDHEIQIHYYFLEFFQRD